MKLIKTASKKEFDYAASCFNFGNSYTPAEGSQLDIHLTKWQATLPNAIESGRTFLFILAHGDECQLCKATFYADYQAKLEAG